MKSSIIILIVFFDIFNNMRAQTQKTWEWVRQIGGHSWNNSAAMGCDSKNNLYVVGTFSDTLYGDSKKVTTSGNQDIFIARYDEKGSLKDIFKAGGKGFDEALCMTVLNNNSVVTGGIISDNASFGKVTAGSYGTQLFIACLSDKDFTWITTLPTGSDASLFLMDDDSEGIIYTAGVFSDTLQSGNKIVVSKGKKDIFLASYHASGTIRDLISFGSLEDDLPSALTVSDSGSVYLAGYINKACSLDGIDFLPPSTTYKSTPFILRFNKDLQAKEKIQLMGDKFLKISAIRSDRFNNLYVTGNFNLSFTNEDTIITSQGHTDGFLLKFDKSGKRIWGRSFGSPYYDYANHLLIDNVNGAIITGSIGDTLIVDNLMAAPQSDKDATLIVQFTPEGKATWVDCVSGKGSSYSNSSVLDRKGNLYLTGNFTSTFEKGNGTLTSLGPQDAFVARYYNCPGGKADILGDTVICAGASTELRIDQPYIQITWNDTIKNTSFITADQPGLYTVTVIDKHGCMLTDTVQVIAATPSDFSLGADVSLPLESSLLLYAPEGFSGYKWQDDSDKPTCLAQAENHTAGLCLFHLTAVDSSGCLVSDTIAIEFYPSFGWIDAESAQLIIYPNPTENWIYWSVNSEKPCNLIVEVTDNNGRLISNQYVEQYEPSAIKAINFTDIPSGRYFIRIRDGSGRSSQHVSVVRL